LSAEDIDALINDKPKKVEKAEKEVKEVKKA
jgi:hypothetical protein